MIKCWISVIACVFVSSLVAVSQMAEVTFTSQKKGVVKESTSAGVLVDKDGTLATVTSLGFNPSSASVAGADGKKVELKLLAYDPVSRLTLLKLPVEARAGVLVLDTKTASSANLKAGDPLISDITDKTKVGRMVSLVRRHNGKILPLTFIRVNHPDHSLKPGSPVLDKDEKPVGFVFQYSNDEENSFFMLPIEVLNHVKESCVIGKKYSPCWIGISMDDLSDAAVVLGVRPASPAQKAGLKKGDVLLSIAGKPVDGYGAVVNAFYFFQPGKPVDMKVLRGTKLITLKVTPEVNPQYK